jgi:DNA replication and repair protein RecF
VTLVARESHDPTVVPTRPAIARVAVTRLVLGDFRNHTALALDGDGRHVVLVGDNGTGKTNVLEALSLFTPGRGLRRARLDEMARRDGPGSWTAFAEITGPDGRARLGTGFDGGGDENRTRRVRIDGEAARSADDFLSHLRLSWLTPAMDGLFTGPAGDRRRFLDRLVLALDPAHGTRVGAFEKAMRGRNRLLEDPRLDHEWLAAIETEMADLGIAVASARVETVACLARLIAASRSETPFPHAELALEGELEAQLSAGRPAAEIEDLYRARLIEGRRRDAAAGRTLDGPHRADLIVHHGPKAMPAGLSSTGEQKALLLGLVLAHARLVGETTGRAPILLLDEVAAHLDSARRAELFDVLDRLGAQTWMTGTDAAAFAALGARADLWETGGGAIHRRPAG